MLEKKYLGITIRERMSFLPLFAHSCTYMYKNIKAWTLSKIILNTNWGFIMLPENAYQYSKA